MAAMSFEHYEAAKLIPGKTVPLRLEMLPARQGKKPLLQVEFLGETNSAFWSDLIAKSNAEISIGTEKRKNSPERVNEARRENRQTLIKYCVRGLSDAFHSDGKPATNADIDGFIMSLANDIIDRIIAFCQNPENFRDQTFVAEPSVIAEKS